MNDRGYHHIGKLAGREFEVIARRDHVRIYRVNMNFDCGEVMVDGIYVPKQGRWTARGVGGGWLHTSAYNILSHREELQNMGDISQELKKNILEVIDAVKKKKEKRERRKIDMKSLYSD